MSRRSPPVVTGISPKEGKPGTKVVIRGENFGSKPADLTGLTICGVNCLLSAEWKSPSKVIARTGQGDGKGDVIITTKTGGVGSCTVRFNAIPFNPGPLEESAIWIDEIPLEEMHRANHGHSITQISGYQDPLGITKDIRKRQVEDSIDEFYPEGSEDTLSVDFIPAAFLIRKHCDVRFEQLKDGLQHLKKEESRRATGPLAFVKDNITTFMDAEETLTAVQREMLKDQSGSKGGSLAEALGSCLQNASTHADALFQDVLRRKDDADTMRNALSVLHRFRSIFSLPQIIEKNISQGDYEMVVNDYSKAKSLVSDNAPLVFKKVLNEVESKVEKFRNQLRTQLSNLPIALKDMRRYIKYVIGLDSPGDIAWECLENQHKWLLGLLDNCREDHLRKKSRGSGALSLTSYYSPRRESLENYLGWGTRAHAPPRAVIYVDELSDILSESLPDLWKLGNEYLNGSLFKKENTDTDKPSFVPAAERNHEFQGMVRDITKRYSTFLEEVFVGVYKPDHDKNTEWKSRRDEITPWLPKCVKFVRRCYSTLKTQCGKSSFEALKLVQSSLEDLQFLSTRCLMENSVEEIRNLYKNEDWTKEAISNGCVITILPITFETIAIDMLHVLKDVIGEATFGGEKGDEIQKEINELFYKMLQAAIESLEHLGFPSDEELDKISVSSRHHYGSFDSHEDVNSVSSINSPARDERFLIVLSCCSYLRDNVLPKIVSNYQSNGHAGLENLLPSFKCEIMKLEDRIFNAYVELKSEPLVSRIKTGMFAGDFNWGRCKKPDDVRDYVKVVILELIVIHAQVFSSSASFVPRVLSRLTEILTETVYKLFKNAKGKYSTNGIIQARLELTSLREALQNWLTDKSRSFLENTYKCIPAISKEDHQREIEKLLKEFKARSNFQLLCFDESGSVETKS
ncbi:exocyst complex component 2-like isoform X2 [Xenia sp. Carnegie-2017]|uniref:exocyst complex component 2-like isoform X2 n=1 Tax=Xenia sp. Carnegie-2017 TaxID=2897299 RepID=UPI001F03752D|nr:exocyst complex component 2-like isoform X2 [Xenia sp. Carnegie-2017]